MPLLIEQEYVISYEGRWKWILPRTLNVLLRQWFLHQGTLVPGASSSSLGARQGSQTRGPREHFVRPAMLLGNFQIINMYVAKCLEKRCREIIEPRLNDTQCGLVPRRSATEQQHRQNIHSPANLRILEMLKTSHMLCLPRESVRPSGDSRMTKVGGLLRDQGKSKGGNINVYLAWWFFIVLKIKLLWLTLSNPT